MSLKEFIIASYGTSVQHDAAELKEVKKKQAKTKNQYIFLQKCVSHKLIPKSLRIRSPIQSNRAKDIVNRYRFELLISIKNDAKRKYFKTFDTIKNLEQKLRTVMSNEDMENIVNLTNAAREGMFIKSKERLMKKFKLLQQEKRRSVDTNSEKETPTTLMKDTVLNLCNDEIPKHHAELLNLGPKFVPYTKKIPWMDLVSKTESSALKLEYSKKSKKIEDAQTLRKDVLRLLKMHKDGKDNLRKEDRKAIQEIKKDEIISIYPFDKGSGFVRIKTEDAKKKIREQVGPTKLLDKDPTPSITQSVKKILGDLNKKKRFTKKEYEKLYPSDPIPPRMYGTIKAHKPSKNYPARVVVSTIGTVTYGISEYLVNIIQPILNKNNTRLKNSTSFVKEAACWDIAKEEVQVSYDVVNLYPSVPLKEATTVILDMIKGDSDLKNRTKLTINEIKQLIEICLNRCYFVWNGEIHELEDSGPIGLSVMVVMAEGFLQHHERKAINIALNSTPPIELKSFYRYVDDSHARFPKADQAERFKDILNQQHSKIQYTLDLENEEKVLNFLDISIQNNRNGKYEFNIHRKDAITNVQVKPDSNHDPRILRGIFKGFVHRAFSICSTIHLQEELVFLKNVFIENGYNRSDLGKVINEVQESHNETTRAGNEELRTHNEDLSAHNENLRAQNGLPNGDNQNENSNLQTISLPWIPKLSPKLRKAYKKAGYKVVFKSNSNLQQILTSKNKTRLPKNSNPGVYKIKCAKHRDNPYVGETKMQIKTRAGQHQENVRKKKVEQSAIALHQANCDGDIEWGEVETVKVERNKFDRKVREALEIQYNHCGPNKGGMNLDDGKYVTTKFWTPYFASKKKAEKKDERQKTHTEFPGISPNNTDVIRTDVIAGIETQG